MTLEAKEYMVQSQKTKEKVDHKYGIGGFGEIKNMIKGQNLSEEQYETFKNTVEGLQEITKEIESIKEGHKKRLNGNELIHILETKVTLNSICGVKKQK